MLSRGCTCSALTAISKDILLQNVGLLNPTMLPQKLRKVEREDGKNGKEVSMDDLFEGDSHIDADV